MPGVTFQQTSNLGEIVIDNPPQNVFSPEMFGEFGAVIQEAASSDMRALLIRAEGDDFSVGPDPSVLMGLDDATAKQLEESVLGFMLAVDSIEVPTVALVQGQCYTGAVEICVACDFIWMAGGSVLGQVEVAAGGMPFGGGTQRIAARVGAARAAQMVIAAETPSPETLLAWGLINRVLPKEDLLREGRAFAEQLSNGPTVSYRAIKKVIHAWRTGGVGAADEVNLAVGPTVMLSDDLQNGLQSLVREGFGHATFAGR